MHPRSAAKFFSLQRVEWLGLVLFVVTCGVVSAACPALMGEARGTARSVDHQDFRRQITAIAFGCSLYGASRQIEQVVERFIGLDFRNLGGGRLASHRVPHPPLEPLQLEAEHTTAPNTSPGARSRH